MSTNVSKQKRKDLIDKIKAIHKHIASTKPDENTRNFLVWLSEIEKEIGTKKFGLVFEEHREDIDDTLETHTPVLTENKKLFIDNGGQVNFLIEGDNLAALQLLLKTHKGKIDVIYIDPPYNTLNEGFTYSDKLVDKNDTFRHSKWLSFIDKRLNIAKHILSKKGAIFISIDDNEVGALRLLCDEIFGSQNFVANIIWEKKFSPQNDAKWLSDSHDHILLYAKDKENWQPNLLQRTSAADSRYKNPDNDPRGLWASSDFTVKTPSDAYIYPITTPSGRIVMPAKSRSWTTSEQNFLALKEDNRIWFGENGNNIPRIKSFLSEVKEGLVCKTIWYRTEVGDTQEGTRDLKAVFDGQLPFTNPKPIRLIERIIQIASNNESIILDFFAGCGTTGHSLLRFNSEHHESKRRFILCTNNENEICRKVTYERIKKTIKKEKYSSSLKYYKIDYVPISDRLYYEYADELLEHIRELVELENAINFLGNDKIAIVLTDEELDDFVKNIKKNKNCRKLYRAHNVLVSGEQKEKLKSAKVKVNVIPDYYYGDMEI